MRCGVNAAGDREAELDLAVADAVAADDDAAGRAAGVGTATQDLDQQVHRELLIGEADEVQRGERLGAHGVDVAERVGGGDATEGERVIDQRREEIRGLHERKLVRKPEHTRIVAGIGPDQQVRVRHGLELAQHLRQAVLRQLAGSAGTGRVIGQTDFARYAHAGMVCDGGRKRQNGKMRGVTLRG